ncbi:hypothetical protein [Pseudomonas sp. CGJS7]|uniref:hypothetical protein n=1 Tax=Pseudomonas sp. CGJS7 TaxID=3109348 RepID=UPI00300ACDE9
MNAWYWQRAVFAVALLLCATTQVKADVGLMCRSMPGGSVVVDGIVHPSQPIQVCEFVGDPTDGGGSVGGGSGGTGGGGGGGGFGGGEDIYPEGPAAAFPVGPCSGGDVDREQLAFATYKAWMAAQYRNTGRQMIQDAKFRAEQATIMLVFWKDGAGTGAIYRRTDSSYASSHGMLETVAPRCE